MRLRSYNSRIVEAFGVVGMIVVFLLVLFAAFFALELGSTVGVFSVLGSAILLFNVPVAVIHLRSQTHHAIDDQIVPR